MQIADLKKKQENQSHLLRAKQRIEESAKRLQEEIQRIKAHKVQCCILKYLSWKFGFRPHNVASIEGLLKCRVPAVLMNASKF